MRKYLTFENYDGTLSGRETYPVGVRDVASPGGLESISHHWTGGMYGRGDTTVDLYAGTGERYKTGTYGDFYTPQSHGSLWKTYSGPHTEMTENQTLQGEEYYWNNMSSRPNISNAPIPLGEPGRRVNSVPPVVARARENYERIPSSHTRHPVDLKKSPINVTVEPVSIDEAMIGAVSAPDIEADTGNSKVCVSGISTNKHVTLIVAIFVLTLAAVTFEFWSNAVESYLKQVMYKHSEFKWSTYATLAAGSTVALFAIVSLLGAQGEIIV